METRNGHVRKVRPWNAVATLMSLPMKKDRVAQLHWFLFYLGVKDLPWDFALKQEPEPARWLMSRFREGDVFLDIGANVGCYSIHAAMEGMVVHSFEPDAVTMKRLAEHASEHGAKLNLHQVAIGGTSERAWLQDMGNLASHRGASRVNRAGVGETVEVRTIDDLQLGRVDLVKIDAEGMEYEAVRGGMATLSRFHPAMLIEIHSWLPEEDRSKLYGDLAALGYKISYLTPEHRGQAHISAVWG